MTFPGVIYSTLDPFSTLNYTFHTLIDATIKSMLSVGCGGNACSKTALPREL